MFKEYSRRLVICVLGLALFSLGNLFGIKAGAAGTNAWNTLALGISSITGISFGSSTLAISAVIILVDLAGRGKLGVGTILNATLISWFSDLFLEIFSFVPEATGLIGGIACTLAGQMILAFACVVYMSPALGAGPRDTLMIIIGKKFPGAPIGTVKFCMEIVVLLIGFLLGARVGLGTVLVMLLQASLFQLACRLCRFEPRSVKHEDVLDTYRRITGKA